MSRVGKAPIKLPSGVTLNQTPAGLEVKGARGLLHMSLSERVELKMAEGAVEIAPKDKTKETRMIWGTTQKLLSNLVQGVSQGFKVELEIQGVGYRAAMQGSDLVLALGFSHEVRFPIPAGIKITTDKPTSILVEGIDCQKVGQVAANIRRFRPPEPYKGKGIRYKGEIVLRKEGKKK